MDHPFVQLKSNSQIENVKNAAKQGYTRTSGESSFSKLARTKRIRTTTVRTMPTTPHSSQDGKNDPSMLKEGAREQPVDASMGMALVAIAASRNLPK
jgi:hypothetical protein